MYLVISGYLRNLFMLCTLNRKLETLSTDISYILKFCVHIGRPISRVACLKMLI